MDSLSIILLAVPFFLAGAGRCQQIGGDNVSAADAGFGMNAEDLKIWFGILMLVVVELGLITPPVGIPSSSYRRWPRMSDGQDFPRRRAIFIAEMFRVSLLVLFPVITLWLPKALGG